uniref:Putative Gag-polypeptide of LTR copia-type n=1 Tax=Tanacetum cinerariifolium TaxID=118510 RepID=A0A6L2NU49_TANCI|nr:putative Gag-polypeptide of LTR copia-type [Tanacetum cinerariifolium]
MQISERSSRTALDHFCQAVMEIYGPEFLRKPAMTDIEKLYRHHEEKHGFSEMLGSLDCTDWEWFDCSHAFIAQYVKRDHGSNPFILFEVVASQDLWIWHAFFSVAGSNNDINVLYQSPLFNDLKTGRAPEISFVAIMTGNEGDKGGSSMIDFSSPYYLHPSDSPKQPSINEVLTDGNYNDWAREMTNFLFAKNKTDFVDGTLKKPETLFSEYKSWMRCDAMIKGWLNTAMEKGIRDSVKYANTSSEIWSDLKERFGKERASYEELDWIGTVLGPEIEEDHAISHEEPELRSKGFELKQLISDENWQNAMQQEIKALKKNETWTLEELPDGKRAIYSKWVYKTKFKSNGDVERYKARLVAKGENFFCSLGKRNRVNACTAYMLYYLTIRRKFNFTSMIIYRMEEVINKCNGPMPFAILLTRLYNHILQTNPHAIVPLARFTFHERVMDPLDISRNHSKEKGKSVVASSLVTSFSPSPSDDNKGPSFLEFYDELSNNEDLTKAQREKIGMFKFLNRYVVTITKHLKKQK